MYKTFDSIKIIKRPGEMNQVGKYILNEVFDFATRHGIKVLDEVTIEMALYVAIGGDGTMLAAMDESTKQNYSVDHPATSVVGFNAGNLGFLTEDAGRMRPSFLLSSILERDSDWAKPIDRAVLETSFDGKTHFAINEFTFAPSSVAEMLTFQVDINDHFMTELSGSGVLVSTATGSTAMAMSAGGAIISPSTDIMQIVPMMPHSLTSRPVITGADDKITIRSEMERVTSVEIHSDGRPVRAFDRDAEMTITKAKYPVRVWYSGERDFFQVLSHKLDW